MLGWGIASQPNMSIGLVRSLVAKLLEGIGQRYPAYRAGQHS